MQIKFLPNIQGGQSSVSQVSALMKPLLVVSLFKNILSYCFHAEVTGKAIEETAAVIVRIHHDRKQKCSMPRISKRY